MQVLGVSVNTAVTDGERTFNITWRVSHRKHSTIAPHTLMPAEKVYFNSALSPPLYAHEITRRFSLSL